jgi:hypothetical protein
MKRSVSVRKEKRKRKSRKKKEREKRAKKGLNGKECIKRKREI